MNWMTEGHKYRIWYKLDGQRKTRSFVGTYMGLNAYDDEMFNLRPAAGTSSLPHDAIEAFRPTDAAHSQPVQVENIPSIAEDETTGYQYGPRT